ncbi:hypothetical protein Acsp05_62280 [Actinokineospora sp. NBRC 105648]|nr:hypothetical protein Acsp05_62280 [Actinokineospora sp. NBRC 105648]
MAQVGTAVEVDEPNPTIALVRDQPGTEEQAAITAEHHREVTCGNRRSQPVGKSTRVRVDLAGVEDTTALAPPTPVIARRDKMPQVTGPKTAQQTTITQRTGRLGGAGHRTRHRRPKTEVGGRVQQGKGHANQCKPMTSYPETTKCEVGAMTRGLGDVVVLNGVNWLCSGPLRKEAPG